MAPRPRSTATARQLADAFTVLAKARGPMFCTYSDESSNVDGAKLRKTGPGNIYEDCNVESIRALHRCGRGNMTVPKKTMEQMLRMVAERCQSQWKLLPHEVDDFATTVGRRLRNLARVTAQGQVKSPGARWLTMMRLPDTYEEEEKEEDDGSASGELGDEDAEDAGECISRGGVFQPLAPMASLTQVTGAPSKADCYDVGWSHELMLPVRKRRLGAALGPPEPGLPINTALPRGSDDELVVAHWHDGYVARITDFTWSQLRLLTRESTKPKSSTVFYETEHASNKHKLQIVQKVDRKLLMVINEQSRQILQVNLDQFGELSDQRKQVSNDHPCVQRAGAFLREICDLYAEGKLDRSCLKRARNERLVAMGAAPRRQEPRPPETDEAQTRRRVRAKTSGEKAAAKKLDVAAPTFDEGKARLVGATPVVVATPTSAPAESVARAAVIAPPLLSSLDVLMLSSV